MVFVGKFSEIPQQGGVVQVVDKILVRKINIQRDGKSRRHNQGQPQQHLIAVKAGEKLKSLDGLQDFFKQLNRFQRKRGNDFPLKTVRGVGGGSIGDFAGFVASIYRRGIELQLVPSTWLSAIDSAHGGKNALNLNGIKNQLGTFYMPSKVWIVKELLTLQPQVRAQDAWGEVIKIGLIQGGNLWRQVKSASPSDLNGLLRLLPRLIEAKMRVVRKDPLEKSGFRQILNLGHSVGHVLESALKIPHGIAVLHGIFFSLRWSLQLDMISFSHYSEIENHLNSLKIISKKDQLKALKSAAKKWHLILADKKAIGSGFHFIFLKGPGKVFRKAVTYRQFKSEWNRQIRCLESQARDY